MSDRIPYIGDFPIYLQKQGLSDKTVATYFGHARKALKDGMRHTNGAAFDHYLWSFGLATQGMRRAAWKLYLQWLVEEFDLTVDYPTSCKNLPPGRKTDPIHEALMAFGQWLVDRGHARASTATQYAYAIQRVVRLAGPEQTPEQLRAAIQPMHLSPSSARARAGWRHYQQWLRETYGKEVIDPFKSEQQIDTPPPMIDLTWADACALKAIMDCPGPHEQLPYLRWKHLKKEADGSWGILDIGDFRYLQGHTTNLAQWGGTIPRWAYTRWRQWAQPTSEDDPLIPVQPGSTTPCEPREFRELRERMKTTVFRGPAPGEQHPIASEKPAAPVEDRPRGTPPSVGFDSPTSRDNS